MPRTLTRLKYESYPTLNPTLKYPVKQLREIRGRHCGSGTKNGLGGVFAKERDDVCQIAPHSIGMLPQVMLLSCDVAGKWSVEELFCLMAHNRYWLAERA